MLAFIVGLLPVTACTRLSVEGVLSRRFGVESDWVHLCLLLESLPVDEVHTELLVSDFEEANTAAALCVPTAGVKELPNVSLVVFEEVEK